MKSKSLSIAEGQSWVAQFLPNPSARAEWLLAGIIDRALHQWRHVPALDGGLATTTSTTLRLTQPYLTTTMTLSPWRAARMNLCSHQVSSCLVYSMCTPPRTQKRLHSSVQTLGSRPALSPTSSWLLPLLWAGANLATCHLCTAQAVHEVVTEEYRILDTLNHEVATSTLEDWVRLFDTRFSFSEHLL